MPPFHGNAGPGGSDSALVTPGLALVVAAGRRFDLAVVHRVALRLAQRRAISHTSSTMHIVGSDRPAVVKPVASLISQARQYG